MNYYIENLLDESPADMSGTAAAPAANHLFTVNENVTNLDVDKDEKFHHLLIAAKMLYLCRRVRPDIQQKAVAFM